MTEEIKKLEEATMCCKHPSAVKAFREKYGEPYMTCLQRAAVAHLDQLKTGGWSFNMDEAPRDYEVLVTDGLRVEKAWYGVDYNNQGGKEEWLYGTGDGFSIGHYFTPINPTAWKHIHLPTAPDGGE